MPSTAYTGHFLPLLADAVELLAAQEELRSGSAERRPELLSLNRAVVVACISAWEAFVEELVRVSLELIRPSGALGTWPALNAAARGLLGRFNTPNTEQVRSLLSDTLGLPDIHLSWSWHGCTSALAGQRLGQAMEHRHRIAHGVNPRPVVLRSYAGPLPKFFQKLARQTDRAVRAYLVGTLGVPNPWPR